MGSFGVQNLDWLKREFSMRAYEGVDAQKSERKKTELIKFYTDRSTQNGRLLHLVSD